MKTCDEYVLKQLEDTKEELSLVRKENEELKQKLENRSIDEMNTEDLPKAKTITISEQPNYYYQIGYTSYSYINELLKENDKTPEFLRQVLVDDNAFEEYTKLTYYRYGTEYGAVISRNYYDYLMVNYWGRKYIIYETYDHQSDIHEIDNKNYFLDEEKAKSYLKESVLSTIKYYFEKKYDEEFEPKEKEKKSE